jgi:anti-sigma regulatory factor (Ser/Thr protein kinase)/serine/threonine protein phosphatase PrpC
VGIVNGGDLLNAMTAELRVVDPADVAAARRLAGSWARQHKFQPLQEHRVELVATEMATNLVKYAAEGRFLVSLGSHRSAPVLDLLSLDSGPGMGDAETHLADGSSTGSSLGGGLGAMARVSDAFDIHSERPGGTVVIARFALEASSRPGPGPAGSTVGAVCRPHPSETVCGDALAFEERDGRLMVLVADGLGHGPGAAEASSLAVEVFRQQSDLPAEEIVTAIHRELGATRGAAVSVAEVRPDARVRFCGIGNVSGALATATGRREMVGDHGTAGHQARKIRSFEYLREPGALVILHSDGLSGRWDLRDHPSLAARHPLVVAGVLYRDHRRGRDDATVVVVAPGRGAS